MTVLSRQVSSTETGIIYGNVVYDMGAGAASDSNLDGKHMVTPKP